MSEGTMRAGLIAFGVVNLVLGAWMAIDPGGFFDNIGPYGARNDHYLGDVAAFYLAAGAGLLIAVNRPAWREPVLVVAALWYGLHALNHVIDIGENNESDARGAVDALLLGVGALVLAGMARAAGRGAHDGAAGAAATVQRPPPPPRRPDYPPGD